MMRDLCDIEECFVAVGKCRPSHVSASLEWEADVRSLERVDICEVYMNIARVLFGSIAIVVGIVCRFFDLMLIDMVLL
jgi:hypothetical protein